MRFVDTNVLIYAVSTQPEDRLEAARAETRLASRDLAFSVQVLQEITLAVVADAFRLRERFGLSYWDCAILAAARACGCGTVLSEDMGDGEDDDGGRVVNPFRERGPARR